MEAWANGGRWWECANRKAHRGYAMSPFRSHHTTGGGWPLMNHCRATKANGDPCTLPAKGPHGFCWAHAPENAEKRRSMASKAAKAKPNRELRDIKGLLSDLTDRVLAGELETGPAAVANQLINTRLRAIEQERKTKETEELVERIERLERDQGQKGVTRWQRT